VEAFLLALSEGLQVYPSCKREKVFRRVIIQGASLVFRNDESFFIFDGEASTVTL
jgi:hypothetical protein